MSSKIKLFKWIENEGDIENVPVEHLFQSRFEIDDLYLLFYNLIGCVDELSNLSEKEKIKFLENKFNELIPNITAKTDKFLISKNFSPVFEDDLFSYYFLSDSQMKTGNKIVCKFNEEYKKLFECLKECQINIELIINYLKAYKKLLAFIFSSKLVCSKEFQKLIERALNIGLAIDENEMYMTCMSPFILYNLVRSFYSIIKLTEEYTEAKLSRFENMSNELFEVKRSVLASEIVKSFSRKALYDKKMHLVKYSKEKGYFTFNNIDNVSSIEKISPIYLFEKITSEILYKISQDINNGNIRDNKISVSIAIIGSCTVIEENGKFYTKEVSDLIYEIFKWFTKTYNGKYTLDLNINYYIATDDIIGNVTENKVEFTEVYESSTDENIQGFCNLNIIAHKNTNDIVNAKSLENIIASNNITFALDVPQFIKPNFHHDRGDISSFAQYLSNFDLVDSLASAGDAFTFINEASICKVMNRSRKYQELVFDLQEYIANWIQYTVNKNSNTIYMYISKPNTYFVDYDGYIFTKYEQCDNNEFSVLRFRNAPKEKVNSFIFAYKNKMVMNEILEISKKTNITVSFWDILKYLDKSFVYSYLSSVFSKDISYTDILTITKNILINFTNCNYNKKSISVKIDIDDNLQNRDMIYELIKELIKKEIFTTHAKIYTQEIKNAYLHAIYDNSKTIDDIMFVAMYRTFNKDQIMFSDVSIAKGKIDTLNVSISYEDIMSDKYAYYCLVNLFALPNYPEYAVNVILNQYVYGFKDNSLLKSIQRNMIEFIEKNKLTESFLYENIKKHIN